MNRPARPRLLDLFCCAGGASVGYYRAGFEVVGVDIDPQPNYPYEFHQADALTFPLGGFDVVHASPPCQGYSVANNRWAADHPRLIAATRGRLIGSGVTYVIENVEGARRDLENPVLVCGLSLGLNVRRHRLFESSAPLRGTRCGDHSGDWLSVFGTGNPRKRQRSGQSRGTASLDDGRRAMGIDWTTGREMGEAIPPAYAEFIGAQLIAHLDSA